MNSKLLILILFIFVSCGLKTNPKEPPGTKLPSLTKKYSYKIDAPKEVVQPTEEVKAKEEEEKKKEKK